MFPHLFDGRGQRPTRIDAVMPTIRFPERGAGCLWLQTWGSRRQALPQVQHAARGLGARRISAGCGHPRGGVPWRRRAPPCRSISTQPNMLLENLRFSPGKGIFLEIAKEMASLPTLINDDSARSTARMLSAAWSNT